MHRNPALLTLQLRSVANARSLRSIGAVKTMETCSELARSAGLDFVYLDNLPGHRAGSTYCPKCGKVVVQRLGFSVLEKHLRRGRCGYCGRGIPGVWA